MKLQSLEQLNHARQQRKAAISVTEVATGHVRVVLEADVTATDPLAAELSARFASGASGLVDEGRVFLTVHLPPPRLVVIGAVHISQALAPMAKLAGFDVTIIDPRNAFATADRFPDVRLIAEWPEEVIARIGFDAFTAVAALTHDPKIDDAALIAALQAGCFYVGALGSRKTHAKRLDRLREAGLNDAHLARMHAPIGLSIHAQSPAEIAVAILAEIISDLRTRGRADKDAAA